MTKIPDIRKKFENMAKIPDIRKKHLFLATRE